MSEIDLKKVKIIPSDKKHDLRQFSCKIQDLNDFLIEESYKQKEVMLNVTYLALYDEKIIGYFTLSSDSIKISNLLGDYKKKFKDKDVYYKVFPAIKIGRFGIDKKFENKGLGKFLFHRIVENVFLMSKQIGIRFITIDSYVSAYGFYKKMRCKDAIKQEKVKNKLKKFKRLVFQKKYKESENITIFVFFDLYEFYHQTSKKVHTPPYYLEFLS